MWSGTSLVKATCDLNQGSFFSNHANHREAVLLTLTQLNSLFEGIGTFVLDGGLATELERQGHDLNHQLWSAQLLMTNPGAIRNAHLAYLESGAMCITTASYQASFPGLAAAGVSEAQARKLLMDSVSIAQKAVSDVLGRPWRQAEMDRRFVAASIGPYGAFLADGSEYRGNYGISVDELRNFHAKRLDVIYQAQPDLLACETIPCAKEAQVLRDLLAESSEAMAWVSFSCVDGERICDGTPIQECAALFENCQQVFAIGLNCTAPQHVQSLIEKIQVAAPNKRVIVYPNSGQVYNAHGRRWTGSSSAAVFGQLAKEWRDAGATLIGGCCQTGPEHICAIREAIRDDHPQPQETGKTDAETRPGGGQLD
jgi:homocysteine S-methyltransferase